MGVLLRVIAGDLGPPTPSQHVNHFDRTFFDDSVDHAIQVGSGFNGTKVRGLRRVVGLAISWKIDRDDGPTFGGKGIHHRVAGQWEVPIRLCTVRCAGQQYEHPLRRLPSRSRFFANTNTNTVMNNGVFMRLDRFLAVGIWTVGASLGGRWHQRSIAWRIGGVVAARQQDKESNEDGVATACMRLVSAHLNCRLTNRPMVRVPSASIRSRNPGASGAGS